MDVAILNAISPILICIITGIFAIHQHRLKLREDIRLEREEKFLDRLGTLEATLQESMAEVAEALTENLEYRKESKKDRSQLRENIEKLQTALYENDCTTRRIEITMMIEHHPDEIMAIQELIEEYEGNHYVYDMAIKWAKEKNIKLNPGLLGKLSPVIIRNLSDRTATESGG